MSSNATSVVKIILDKALNNESMAIIGQSVTGKTTLACQILLKKIEENPQTTAIILTPRNSQNKIITNLLAKNLKVSLKGTHVRTPSSFALHISEIWHKKRKDPIPVPQVASISKQSLLVRKIVDDNIEEFSKFLHTDFIATDDFIKKVIDVIELCEEYNVDKSMLYSLAEEYQIKNWNIIARILEEMQKSIDFSSHTRTQGQLISASAIQYYAIHLLQTWETEKYTQQVKASIPIPECIIVDDFQDFSQSTINLIKTCYEKGSQIICFSSPSQTVKENKWAIPNEIFNFQKDLNLSLHILKEQYFSNEKIYDVQKNIAKYIPSKTIYDYKNTVLKKDEKVKLEEKNSVDIKIFKNIYDEHKYLSKIIREKNLLQNIPLKEIALIVPNESEAYISKQLLTSNNVKCNTYANTRTLNKCVVVKTMLKMILQLCDIAQFLNQIAQKSDEEKQNKHICYDIYLSTTNNKKNINPKLFECLKNKTDFLSFVNNIRVLATNPLIGLDSFSIKRIETLMIFDEKQNSEKNEIFTEEKYLFANLIFSNNIENFFEKYSAYFDNKICEKVLLLQNVILKTLREIMRSVHNVEKIIWTFWENSDKSKKWQDIVIKKENNYLQINDYLDNIIILLDEASWCIKRNTRVTIQDFCIEQLEQNFQTETVAKISNQENVVNILTPPQSVGRFFDHVIIRGLERTNWPALKRYQQIFEIDLLNRIFKQEITLDDPAWQNIVLRMEYFNKQSWITQMRLFYQSATRARSSLLFVANEEENAPSVYIEIVNDILKKFIYKDNAKTEYKHEHVNKMLDLKSHIIYFRKILNERLENDFIEEKSVKNNNLVSKKYEIAAKVVNILRNHRVIGADYEHWYKQIPISSFVPISMSDEQIILSPSGVEYLQKCPLNWVLENKCGGREKISAEQTYGNIIHEIAEKYPHIMDENGEDITYRIRAELNEKIAELKLGDSLPDKIARKNLIQLCENYIDYISCHFEKVEVEKKLRGEITNISQTQKFLVSGRIDRVEYPENEKVYIVDLKTGGHKYSKSEVEKNLQLAIYQLLFNSNNYKDNDSVLGAKIVSLKQNSIFLQNRLGINNADKLCDQILEKYEQDEKNEFKHWIPKNEIHNVDEIMLANKDLNKNLVEKYVKVLSKEISSDAYNEIIQKSYDMKKKNVKKIIKTLFENIENIPKVVPKINNHEEIETALDYCFKTHKSPIIIQKLDEKKCPICEILFENDSDANQSDG